MKNDVPFDLEDLLAGLDDEAPLIDDGELPMTRAGLVDYNRQQALSPESADIRALFGPSITKSLTRDELRDADVTKMLGEIQLGVDDDGGFRSELPTAKERARARLTLQMTKLFAQMNQVFTPERFAQEVGKFRLLMKGALVEAARDAN
ncbi:MAG TPA: hypothetical protein VKW06_16160 [Candidatus Angelobacter sp.]|nr:hypothetical protein [Candidatus Angelobacter sp.]